MAEGTSAGRLDVLLVDVVGGDLAVEDHGFDGESAGAGSVLVALVLIVGSDVERAPVSAHPTMIPEACRRSPGHQ
ncbi:hypothetical protein ACIG5E_39365, partial [Kitasatospora sp. NPDC053057]|uniref:hypothetical protein n=1 Tax=Kitasatospora sp. NPDC053057 TaxID=3364062 RepID=UPI0037C8BB59